MNLLDWIDLWRDGFHDYRLNFRMWRKVVCQGNIHNWQLVTFWYWLNYPSSEGN